MEIGGSFHIAKKFYRLCICLMCVLLAQCTAIAQMPDKLFTIKDGKMIIILNKTLNETAVDSFVVKYSLFDLPLKHFMKTGSPDSLQKLGWYFDVNSAELISISKPLSGFNDPINPWDKILFMEKHRDLDVRFPSVSNNVVFGYNRFKNKNSFAFHDSTVTFYLGNNLHASQVMLAGSFNNWDPEAQRMTKTDSGWIAYVKLAPGKYWYKFIADGEWMVDGENLNKENDGEGNINSVYYKTNINFSFRPPRAAKRVYLSGSFNNWREKDLLMNKTGDSWQLAAYLANGTHTYKFIADGQWFADPQNPTRLNDGNHGFNSVITLGSPYLFTLDGYSSAKKVILSGTFNGWKEDELQMVKTASGWQLPYVIGPGNYQYKFIVDGQWLTDPANPTTVINEHNTSNSFLIIKPNYTFRLKGFENAKQVFLAGEFNDWSPNAFAMKRVGDEWIFSVYLSPGKHIYKFVVDGKWINDPGNPLWEQNEYDTGNSVLWLKNE
jgi:hypothetical protein